MTLMAKQVLPKCLWGSISTLFSFIHSLAFDFYKHDLYLSYLAMCENTYVYTYLHIYWNLKKSSYAPFIQFLEFQ